MYSLFRSYGHNATVISYKRFGRLAPNQGQPGASRNSRLLRMELSTSLERDGLVATCHFHRLRTSKTMKKTTDVLNAVVVAPRLRQEEAARMRKLRQVCRELNRQVATSRLVDPHVVISGRIMVRGKNRLRNYQLLRCVLSANLTKAIDINKVKEANVISSTPQEPASKLPSMAAFTCGRTMSTSKCTSASLGHINFRKVIKFTEKDGLQAVDVVANGACVFRIVSLCVSGNEEGCQELRVATVKYVSLHATEYKEISPRDSYEDLSFEKYFKKIALPHQMVG